MLNNKKIRALALETNAYVREFHGVLTDTCEELTYNAGAAFGYSLDNYPGDGELQKKAKEAYILAQKVNVKVVRLNASIVPFTEYMERSCIAAEFIVKHHTDMLKYTPNPELVEKGLQRVTVELPPKTADKPMDALKPTSRFVQETDMAQVNMDINTINKATHSVMEVHKQAALEMGPHAEHIQHLKPEVKPPALILSTISNGNHAIRLGAQIIEKLQDLWLDISAVVRKLDEHEALLKERETEERPSKKPRT